MSTEDLFIASKELNRNRFPLNILDVSCRYPVSPFDTQRSYSISGILIFDCI